MRVGVYVITSAGLVAGRGHLEVGRAAVEGGADALQLRAPELGGAELLPLARQLAAECRAAGTAFIVNDRVDVAIDSGASGVHVGQSDDPTGARAAIGPDGILGVSVTTLGEARAAEACGADYLGVTVWATATKPEATPVGLDRFREIAAVARIPIVGIGGIDASNAALVLGAGAAGVAVISAVGAAPDPVAATRSLVDAVHAHSIKGARWQ